MIVVHHLNNSRSQRVLWLLEELGVPYEVQFYQRDRNMLAPASLKRVHPLGKSPVITDGAVTVAETGAIMEYLLDKYGGDRLRPVEGSPERLRYTYWMYAAEGSAMPPLLLTLIFQKIVSSPKPFFVQPIARGIAAKVTSQFIGPQLNGMLDYMERTLSESSWFAGATFTAADIMMSFPVEAASARADLSSRPHLVKFLSTINARPAYQRALQRGGPYSVGE